MLTEFHYKKLLDEIKEEFSDFKIINKSNSSLMIIIDAILKLITFGQMTVFMKDFTTTLGQKIYVPKEWDNYSLLQKVATIRHERIHMRQARKYTRPVFSFLYLMVLPIGFAFFRKKFEQEAYQETIITYYEYYGDKIFTSEMRDRMVSHFTSSSYFWMWIIKKDIEVWYDSFLENLKNKNGD